MASVHKEIRRPEHDPPASGGRLVLVTGHASEQVTFRNPSGHTPQAGVATLPMSTFERFAAHRGIALHILGSIAAVYETPRRCIAGGTARAPAPGSAMFPDLAEMLGQLMAAGRLGVRGGRPPPVAARRAWGGQADAWIRRK